MPRDDDAAALGSNSKLNRHEVDMVVGIACHFLSQGYEPGQITILTPYLGQLSEIRKALASEKVSAAINDQDMGELIRADLNDDSKPKGTESKRSVRAAMHH